MDILLPVLHIFFFAPLLVRLARRGKARTRSDWSVLTEIGAGLRQPLLVLHGTGLVLLWGGLVFALATGRAPRPVTLGSALGAAIVSVAVLLMAFSLAELRSWRLIPQIDTEHQLCTTGAYALVRHPIYLAIDLLGLGSAVWVPTVPVIAAAALLILGGDLRARAEEKVLLEAFGDRYREYTRRVRRTIPGLY